MCHGFKSRAAWEGSWGYKASCAAFKREMWDKREMFWEGNMLGQERGPWSSALYAPQNGGFHVVLDAYQ